MKAVLVCLLLIHGLIHLLGFFKAFELADINQLNQRVARPAGICWLLAAVLFLIACTMVAVNSGIWWLAAAAAILMSQILIIAAWGDAKFGTIANVIILLPVIIALAGALPSSFRNRYEAGVRKRLKAIAETTMVRREDMQHLPLPVQKYLEYVGVPGKPRVHNFRAVFSGGMKRTRNDDWLTISSQQYDFIDDRARLFYIESSMFGIPFDGLHIYSGMGATMEIRVTSLFDVVDAKGDEMNKGETVTLFNDMCLLAPATLVGAAIQWELVDSLSVNARFTSNGITIAAKLSFNEKGELTDFISRDRYLSADGKSYTLYPWSTPVRAYKDFGGRKVPVYGEAIWHMPEGEYVYARFELAAIEYNCDELR